jgi:hypothetical protein
MDYPLEHRIDKTRSVSSRSKAIFRSFCLAFGLEAIFGIAYSLFPYFPMDGGGNSPVGRCVLFLHFPMFWLAGTGLHLIGVWEIAFAALLAVVVWALVFYAAETVWKALR